MHTICTHCHTPFTLCADAQDFVTRMQSTGLQLVMIECPHCQQTTGYTENPKLTAPPDDGFRQPCPSSIATASCATCLAKPKIFTAAANAAKCGQRWIIFRLPKRIKAA